MKNGKKILKLLIICLLSGAVLAYSLGASYTYAAGKSLEATDLGAKPVHISYEEHSSCFPSFATEAKIWKHQQVVYWESDGFQGQLNESELEKMSAAIANLRYAWIPDFTYITLANLRMAWLANSLSLDECESSFYYKVTWSDGTKEEIAAGTCNTENPRGGIAPILTSIGSQQSTLDATNK